MNKLLTIFWSLVFIVASVAGIHFAIEVITNEVTLQTWGASNMRMLYFSISIIALGISIINLVVLQSSKSSK